MIADIHRMENAARVAMGTWQEPDVPARPLASRSVVASVAAAVIAFAAVALTLYGMANQ
jgi:hypothetical protein